MAENTILQVLNISLARGGRRLFDDFSLFMTAGTRLLFDAPSGTGKTTLLRSILGLETVDSGRITVAGLPLDRRHIRSVRSRVAYLSQGVELPPVVIGELFDAVLSYDANRHIQYRRTDLSARLEEWGLPGDVVETSFSDLSGGERQRIGLALLEILDRPLWILDEPTAALDAETARRAVQRILAVPNRSVLVASHDSAWREAEERGEVTGFSKPFLTGGSS